MASPRAAEQRVSWTVHEVIVDHAGRLHQSVTDCRTDKLEATAKKIAAHRIGFCAARQHLCWAPPSILNRFAADEAPKVGVETAELFLYRKERFRILNRSRNLEAIADNPGIAEQPFHLARAVAGDFLGAKSIKRFSVIVPFFQNCYPAQSCLRAFQDQKFKELPIVVHGHSPFFIMIADGRLDRGPRTTRHVSTMREGVPAEQGIASSNRGLRKVELYC